MAVVQSPSLSHYLGVFSFYIKVLPEQLGWPLLLLALIGAATSGFWARREHRIFMLAWVLSCYVVFTLIAHKESRYTFYWTPPLSFFVVGPLVAKWRERTARTLAVGLAVVLVAHAAIVGWKYQRPYMEGYAPVATRIKELNNPGVILFQATLPANFIFFLRRLDTGRQFVVLRKSLRVSRIKVSAGSEALATTVDQVRAVIDQNGVKYVVVSDAPPRFDGEGNLQTLVKSEPRFKLLGTFPISSNEREWKDQHLYLYENSQSVLPSGGSLHIRMLTLGNDIVVPWDELGTGAKPEQ